MSGLKYLPWIARRLLPLADAVLAALAFPSALLLRAIRGIGVHRLPLSLRVLLRVGVFPVIDHYYEPAFDFRHPRRPLSAPRPLPGIDWNVAEQLDLLDSFTFADELKSLPAKKPRHLGFYFENGTFESGDAEFWYQLIRLKKPRRIFEIGSGNSTLMAIEAIRKNRAEDSAYVCKHVCIEPFETPWLEQTGVSVIRRKVEELDTAFFAELERDDVLFIDSSHVIRPDGDVVFEYLELLPTLKRGVIVHVHDIFSPRNYPRRWLVDEVRLWNEQFLVEAFLSHNDVWKVVGALNFLHHNHRDKLRSVAPFLEPGREPGSLYLQRFAD